MVSLMFAGARVHAGFWALGGMGCRFWALVLVPEWELEFVPILRTGWCRFLALGSVPKLGTKKETNIILDLSQRCRDEANKNYT